MTSKDFWKKYFEQNIHMKLYSIPPALFNFNTTACSNDISSSGLLLKKTDGQLEISVIHSVIFRSS